MIVHNPTETIQMNIVCKLMQTAICLKITVLKTLHDFHFSLIIGNFFPCCASG